MEVLILAKENVGIVRVNQSGGFSTLTLQKYLESYAGYTTSTLSDPVYASVVSNASFEAQDYNTGRFTGWYTTPTNTTGQRPTANQASKFLSASRTLSASAAQSGHYYSPVGSSQKIYVIYPAFGPLPFVITFNANGGSGGPNAQTIYSGSSFTLTTSHPSWQGHNFLGWSKSSSATTPSYVPGGTYQWTDFTDNPTLYAIWELSTYTVTLNPNGGSGGTQSVIATYGLNMPSATMPSYPGFTFNGFYDENSQSGGTKYYNEDGSSARTWDKTSNEILYARWTPNKELIITYNPNGGSVTRYFDRVRIGAHVPILPTATFGSETTNRWYTAAIGGTEVHQGDTVTQTSDFMLYAHWSVPINTHTLTFDANGGTVSPVSRTLAEGAAFGTLPTPTRSGYTFVEWRTAPFVGKLVTAATTMGTDDVTIYAIWTGNPLTITLNANGGSVSPTRKSVPNGSTYGILPRPTRSGFIFDGWWTSATGGTKILATAKPSGSQTVYAHWHAQVPEGGSADWIV